MSTTSERLALHREVHGTPTDRAPLLLLHGGGSTIESNFGALIPELVATRQVVAVELQGHGRTPSTDRLPTFEHSADDVAAVLAELDLPAVDVLGFSNGGQVALRLAMRHPARVRRLIAASAFHRRDGLVDGFWDGFAEAGPEALPEVYREADRAVNPDRPGHADELFANDHGQMVRFVDWPDEELAALRTPTLVVAGDRDVIRTEHSVAMAALIPGARLLILPATHGDYLGEVLAAGGDLGAMRRALPYLLDFLDAA